MLIITNNNINNIKNIRKVLNKSEVNPSSLFNNEKNKIEYDKIHLKRTFIKQIPKFNYLDAIIMICDKTKPDSFTSIEKKWS